MILPPFVSALALPALVAFGATGVIRFSNSRRGAGLFAEAGLGAGLLAGFWAVAGGLPFLGNVAYHQWGEAVAVALAAGLLAGLIGAGPRLMGTLAVLGALFAVVWLLGWRQLRDPTTEELVTALVYGAVAVLMALRLRGLGGGGAAPVSVTGLAALALAVVASVGHSAGISALALVLTGACLGYLIWAWPFSRAGFGPMALLLLVVGFAGLMVAEARGALHAPWALLPLPLAFWADGIAARLPLLAKLARKKPSRPVALTLAATLPCLASVALALILAARAHL